MTPVSLLTTLIRLSKSYSTQEMGTKDVMYVTRLAAKYNSLLFTCNKQSFHVQTNGTHHYNAFLRIMRIIKTDSN